jgi:hypothetical protein
MDIIAKELYDKLSVNRKPYEDRAEKLAKVTVPYMYASDSSTSNSDIEDSYGMRYASVLMNSLAANISIALFPPSGSPFRFDPDAEGMEQVTQGDANARAKIMAQLGSQVLRVNKEIERQEIRPVINELLLAMISTQPVIVEKVESKGIKWHSLRNFVVKLDDMGVPLQMVIKETLDPLNLPEEIQGYEDEEEVDLYTMCYIEDGKWIVKQSVGNEEVGQESSYKLDELPYSYLGWIKQHGDEYHRPFCEQYYGILKDYEDINRLNTQGAIGAAKSIILVNPLGSTRKSDISNSANFDIVDGREEDVGSYQLKKNYDFQMPMQKEERLMKMLDRAFLSRQGTQRDAERVTADENARNAEELDKDKAGIFSTLSKKLTKWLVKQIMLELKIKFEAIDVNIITGLDALGRGIEGRKLDNYMMRINNLGYNEWVKEEEVITRYASYDGIDTINLIKTPNEVAEQRQAAAQKAAQQQFAMSSADSVAKAAGQKITEGQGQ